MEGTHVDIQIIRNYFDILQSYVHGLCRNFKLQKEELWRQRAVHSRLKYSAMAMKHGDIAKNVFLIDIRFNFGVQRESEIRFYDR